MNRLLNMMLASVSLTLCTGASATDGPSFTEHSHPTILIIRQGDLDAFFAGKLKPVVWAR